MIKFRQLKSAYDSVTCLSKCLYSTSIPALPNCDFQPNQYKGYDYSKISNIRKESLNPGLLLYYKKPVLIHQGHMQWLWDDKGKRYLDMFAGIVTVSVGHCHPKVTKAATEQLNNLWHTTNIYMHPKIHEYAEKLTAHLPKELSVCFFCNSGSEANDLAMLMSRLKTGAYDIISLRNAYHGASPYNMPLCAVGTWKYMFPSSFGVHHAMNPDPYIGVWGGKYCRDSPVQTQRDCSCSENECQAADLYANELEDVLNYSLPKKGIAAFFAEGIQGVGGTVQFPKGYLKKAYEIVRKRGGLCIADEVQTGFGRLGTHYWGFQAHGVMPDIVTMAKGMGNGFPIAAVVTTPEIAKTLSEALIFNTFGGNPVASAVGSAVLDVIDEENLMANSHKIGTHLLKELAKLRDVYNIVGDVRGKGLMIGLELVINKESKKALPAPDVNEIFENCKDMGLLVGKGGNYGNVLRIKPPMCITMEDANFCVEVINQAIHDYTQKRN